VTAYVDGKLSLFLLTPEQHHLLIKMIATALADWQLANPALARMGRLRGRRLDRAGRQPAVPFQQSGAVVPIYNEHPSGGSTTI